MSALLTARGIGVQRGIRQLLCDFDLAIEGGECWALLGENGCGKSTLLLALANLHPHAGAIELGGETMAHMSRRAIAQRLGLLPQEHFSAFATTVYEAVLAGRYAHLAPLTGESETDHAIARQAMAAMDLTELSDRSTLNLSGGERQRLALATVIAQQPPLYLLDEPLNHLDLRHRLQFLNWLEACIGGNAGILMSLHDPELALRHCSHGLLLFGDGRWLAGPVEEVLNEESLTALYGVPVRRQGERFSYG